MKMKYCPECGSIQLQYTDNGMQCKKCRYTGTMKEDSIDVINSFVVSKKNGNSVSVQASPATSILMKQEQKVDSLKERLKKFENADMEIL